MRPLPVPRPPSTQAPGKFLNKAALLGAVCLSLIACSRRKSRSEDLPLEKPRSATSAALSAPTEPPPSGAAASKPSANRERTAPDPPKAGPSERLTAAEVKARGRELGKKGFLVNAWASWCGPCKEEFPMLVDLQKRFEKVGVALVFVSVDTPESESKAIEFAREYGYQGPVLFAQGSLADFKAGLYPNWPGMLPASFLFEPGGKLRYFWGGAVYESELSPIVLALARGEPIQGESRFDVTPPPQ
jgi:thiol-disulfide isomerase/thioredoxin